MLHGLAQAVHHGFNVFFVKARVHHCVAAHGKTLLCVIAGMDQKLVQTFVFGGGGGHQQVVGREPMGKLAKLGAFVQANVRLVHHQTHLQPLGASARHQRCQGAHVIVPIGVITFGAPLRAGHTLGG